MGATTEYRFDGLDRSEKRLSQMIEQEYPSEFRQLVIQIAYELQGRKGENAPADWPPAGQLDGG